MTQKAKLEFEYHTGAGSSLQKYRLLSRGRFSAGFQDSFLLQEHSEGELGEDAWTTTLDITDAEIVHGLIKALLIHATRSKV